MIVKQIFKEYFDSAEILVPQGIFLIISFSNDYNFQISELTWTQENNELPSASSWLLLNSLAPKLCVIRNLLIFFFLLYKNEIVFH